MVKFRKIMQAAGVLMAAMFGIVAPSQACMSASDVPNIITYPSCKFPDPSSEDKVVFVNVREGNGYSNLSFFEHQTSVTQVQDVVVEFGTQPLYVVAVSAGPIIWRLSGYTERISKFVLMGAHYKGSNSSGVVGLPKDRIDFIRSEHSFITDIQAYFGRFKDEDKFSCTGGKQRRAKHCPIGDYFAPRNSISAIIHSKIPIDHTVNMGFSDRGPLTIPEMTLPHNDSDRRKPTIAVSLDRESVVTTQPLYAVSLMPAEHGLKQLVERGVLHPKGSPFYKEVYDRWNDEQSKRYQSAYDPDFRFDLDVDYVIGKETELPQNLQHVRFLVPPGISIKETIITNSTVCLYFADDKQHRYHRHECEYSRVRSQRDTAVLKAKRLVERSLPVPDASCLLPVSSQRDPAVQVIAVSRFDSEPRGLHCQSDYCRIGDKQGQATVLVNKPGKFVLLLNSVVPTRWRIDVAEGSEVTDILTLGRGTQVLSKFPVSAGLHAVTKPSPKCWPLAPDMGASTGGPSSIILNAAAKAMLGRGLTKYVTRSDGDGDYTIE